MERIILRSSILKEFKSVTGSISKGIWLLKGGQTIPSKNMELGTLAHCKLLEPKSFGNKFLICDEDKRTNKFRAFRDSNKDKIILTTSVVEDSNKMIATLKNAVKNSDNPELIKITKIMTHGKKEEVIAYEENEYNKFIYRIQPDVYYENSIIDYKTTSREYVTLDMWQNTIVDYGYDVQAGFYAKVLELTRGNPIDTFYHIVQSTIPPYLCSFFTLSDKVLKNVKESVDPLISDVNDILENIYGQVFKTFELDDVDTVRDKFMYKNNPF
jgi:hypothetical protein